MNDYPTFQQAELFLPADCTQRWRNRCPTWRHRHEGGFDQARYTITEIPDDATARSFIEAHHYLGTCPAMRFRYGMYEADQLVGIAILSVPGIDPNLEGTQTWKLSQ